MYESICKSRVTCGEALLTLQVKPTADPGLKYEVNPDAEEWFDNFRDECAVNLLFTGTPLPLGYREFITDSSEDAELEMSKLEMTKLASTYDDVRQPKSTYVDVGRRHTSGYVDVR